MEHEERILMDRLIEDRRRGMTCRAWLPRLGGEE